MTHFSETQPHPSSLGTPIPVYPKDLATVPSRAAIKGTVFFKGAVGSVEELRTSKIENTNGWVWKTVIRIARIVEELFYFTINLGDFYNLSEARLHIISKDLRKIERQTIRWLGECKRPEDQKKLEAKVHSIFEQVLLDVNDVKAECWSNDADYQKYVRAYIAEFRHSAFDPKLMADKVKVELKKDVRLEFQKFESNMLSKVEDLKTELSLDEAVVTFLQANVKAVLLMYNNVADPLLSRVDTLETSQEIFDFQRIYLDGLKGPLEAAVKERLGQVKVTTGIKEGFKKYVTSVFATFENDVNKHASPVLDQKKNMYGKEEGDEYKYTLQTVQDTLTLLRKKRDEFIKITNEKDLNIAQLNEEAERLIKMRPDVLKPLLDKIDLIVPKILKTREYLESAPKIFDELVTSTTNLFGQLKNQEDKNYLEEERKLFTDQYDSLMSKINFKKALFVRSTKDLLPKDINVQFEELNKAVKALWNDVIVSSKGVVDSIEKDRKDLLEVMETSKKISDSIETERNKESLFIDGLAAESFFRQEVARDGHCLFNSILTLLKARNPEKYGTYTVEDYRKDVYAYMKENIKTYKEDIHNFMTATITEVLSVDSLEHLKEKLSGYPPQWYDKFAELWKLKGDKDDYNNRIKIFIKLDDSENGAVQLYLSGMANSSGYGAEVELKAICQKEKLPLGVYIFGQRMMEIDDKNKDGVVPEGGIAYDKEKALHLVLFQGSKHYDPLLYFSAPTSTKKDGEATKSGLLPPSKTSPETTTPETKTTSQTEAPKETPGVKEEEKK